MKHLLPFLLFLVLVLFPAVSHAQSKGELGGKVIDKEKKDPLPYATVSVYTAQDTTLVTFRMSDDDGMFKIPNLPQEKRLRVIITMMGYGVYKKEFTLTTEQPTLQLGEIGMETSTNLLSEVLIVAETPPILVRNDTVEFNAASFKTLPTALVEDLLKKLPGVSVDGSGNIRVNGKAVSKIMVDGKEFFGSDPKIASRNLPANVIEKVQVMNDPEALRRDPDMPASEIPQVINLKFKKGVKKGMFGKVYGGAGTDERYEGGGILNMFRDTMQLSVLGYSNNLNQPGFGFEEISRIGGFDRSGFNSMMVMRDGGFALNGISFGGTGQGIQQSSGAGGNFNTVFKNGIKLNLQYFYGGIDSDLNQIVNSSQLVGQDTITSRRLRNQFSKNNSHRIGGKLDWKVDSLTDLSYTPSVTITDSRANQNAYTNTYEDYGELLNESNNRQRYSNNTLTIGNRLSLSRNFRKKGRSLNYYGNYDYSTTLQDQFNIAENIFYRPQPNTTLLDQLRNNDRYSTKFSNSVSYNEPISKTVSAVFRLNSEYFNDNDALYTYNAEPETNDYNQLVPGLSNELRRTGWRNYFTTGIKWKIKDVTVQPGIRFTSLDITNEFQQNPTIKQDFFYVFPTLNVNWKGLYLNYNVNMREPNASDLQPVLDNTNPLFINYGNPGLRPSISNSVSLNYYKYDTKRSLNWDVYLSGDITEDAVTRERTLDENGVQTSRPVNTDGNWQVYSSGGFMKDFKYDNNRQYSIGGRLWGEYRRTLVLFNDIRSFSQTWNLEPSVEARMNLNDKFEFNQTFSLRYQRSTYENDVFDNLKFNTKTSRSEIVIRLPKKLVWEASFDYWYNSNVAPGLRNDYGRLNGGVTFLFMKDDRAQLKLSVYDALDQNLSAYRSIRENIIEDTQTVVLTRYGMLTFTYNIRNFAGKVGGRNTIFRF
ncbi:outer membrane beta-barrel protein [Pontibacter harenae]|uniref:outer membrane beta-barrel protein n=1 Tax=Pontibacter harenae TaxID=2894083 RepID=UPI001E57CDCD|nr:outer membrane beta-barrel protein [Pontibacter harenae]MCC9166985.1 TonB-dependent receptor [Pontibacter harenae]